MKTKFAICIYCWGRGRIDTSDEYYNSSSKCSICRGTGKIPHKIILDKEKYLQHIINHCMDLNGFPLVFKDIIET